jgi:hypothetical protein
MVALDERYRPAYTPESAIVIGTPISLLPRKRLKSSTLSFHRRNPFGGAFVLVYQQRAYLVPQQGSTMVLAIRETQNHKVDIPPMPWMHTKYARI